MTSDSSSTSSPHLTQVPNLSTPRDEVKINSAIRLCAENQLKIFIPCFLCGKTTAVDRLLVITELAVVVRCSGRGCRRVVCASDPSAVKNTRPPTSTRIAGSLMCSESGDSEMKVNLATINRIYGHNGSSNGGPDSEKDSTMWSNTTEGQRSAEADPQAISNRDYSTIGFEDMGDKSLPSHKRSSFGTSCSSIGLSEIYGDRSESPVPSATPPPPARRTSVVLMNIASPVGPRSETPKPTSPPPLLPPTPTPTLTADPSISVEIEAPSTTSDSEPTRIDSPPRRPTIIPPSSLGAQLSDTNVPSPVAEVDETLISRSRSSRAPSVLRNITFPTASPGTPIPSTAGDVTGTQPPRKKRKKLVLENTLGKEGGVRHRLWGAVGRRIARFRFKRKDTAQVTPPPPPSSPPAGHGSLGVIHDVTEPAEASSSGDIDIAYNNALQLDVLRNALQSVQPAGGGPVGQIETVITVTV